jgi:hypothetical protein
MKYRKRATKKTIVMRPAIKPSPELSAVIRTVAAAGRRKPGPTLAKVRAVLQREGMTWSREGELLFPQDRTALLIEIDELIDAYGARADASGLITRRRS